MHPVTGPELVRRIRDGQVGEWATALPVVVCSVGPIEYCVRDFLGLNVSAWLEAPFALGVFCAAIEIVRTIGSRLCALRNVLASLRTAMGASAAWLTYCGDRNLLALEPDRDDRTLRTTLLRVFGDTRWQAPAKETFYGRMEFRRVGLSHEWQLCRCRWADFGLCAIVPASAFREQQARRHMQSVLEKLKGVLLALSKRGRPERFVQDSG
jgi:hypothetical protein